MPIQGLFGKYKLILAPMAGVSDIAFRSLCLEQGADLAFCEMVSAKGLSYANERTRRLLALAQGETEVGVQLFGHEPDVMADQAIWVEEALGDSLAYIDINMGCPARKIVTKGDGSALMKAPDLAHKIVLSVKKNVSCPVTVKFRRGWSTETGETAPEFAKQMEQAGVDAVTVHGRYSVQLYHGCADWDVIRKVKDSVSVPVVGNGDIKSGEDAVRMVEQTGCDAVMIARAAEGNPWVFAQVKAALDEKQQPEKPSACERIHMAKRHAALLSQLGGKNVVRMRKHAMWYMSGLPGASAARAKLNACSTKEDFDKVFDDLLQHIQDDGDTYATRSI